MSIERGAEIAATIQAARAAAQRKFLGTDEYGNKVYEGTELAHAFLADKAKVGVQQHVNGMYLDPDDPGAQEPSDDPGESAPAAREPESKPSLLSGIITAAQLDAMTFAALVEHVPDLITEGFGILAGPPKVGKSWLVNGIALACAQGGTALGAIEVEQRHVLLLALEDGKRRLQKRMRRLNYDQSLPANLDIILTATLGTVAATIREWLDLHRNDSHPPLIILDTLGRARPQRKAQDDPYIADYQLGVKIKTTVDAVSGAALLATTHTRKMGSVDWLDTVSGTQGIAGSADYALVLRRRRKSAHGVLAVTGRDIAENEYALKVDHGIWSLDGTDMTDAAANAETQQDEERQKRRSDRSLDAVVFVASRDEPTTASHLAEHLKIKPKVAGNLLARLHNDDLITRTARGLYTRKNSGESGESSENAGQSTFLLHH